MKFREKREARKRRENEILKEMQESAADAAAEENTAEEERPLETENTGSPAEDPSLRPVAGYRPMTDEEIRKVKRILWPIILVIAILVYFLTHR